MRFAPSLFAVLLFVASPVGAEMRCAAVPKAGCRQPFVPHKSTLLFTQTGRTDPDDIYTWKWQFGSQTALTDFGDPLDTTDYVLCIYDQSVRAQPVVGNVALATTGWNSVRSGFVRNYRPSRALRRLVLHAGRNGKAKIVAHGDSDTVRDILPFVAPVRVQLQAGNGGCWETNLPTPAQNDSGRFKATD
jgi:hypothetical protein